MQAFTSALSSISDEELSHAFVGYVTPELANVKADTSTNACPELAQLLQEFQDVLVSSIPGGLPPVRYDTSGRVIEHTIVTAPDAQPYARTPYPCTPDESAIPLKEAMSLD
jgi:hypothetical protein